MPVGLTWNWNLYILPPTPLTTWCLCNIQQMIEPFSKVRSPYTLLSNTPTSLWSSSSQTGIGWILKCSDAACLACSMKNLKHFQMTGNNNMARTHIPSASPFEAAITWKMSREIERDQLTVDMFLPYPSVVCWSIFRLLFTIRINGGHLCWVRLFCVVKHCNSELVYPKFIIDNHEVGSWV